MCLGSKLRARTRRRHGELEVMIMVVVGLRFELMTGPKLGLEIDWIQLLDITTQHLNPESDEGYNIHVIICSGSSIL